jgi:hypothetical protein
VGDALGRRIEDEAFSKRVGRENREESRLYDWDQISKMYLDHA